MHVARALALVVGCQLTLTGLVADGMTLPTSAAGGSSRSAYAFLSQSDSVLCGSGATASDGADTHPLPLSDARRFAPRWRDGVADVVTVRIDDATTSSGWSPAFRDEVISALRAWEAAGSPVKFLVVASDAPADVTIHWIKKFDKQYDGWTRVTWDGSGWLVRADMTLALHSPKDQLLSAGEREQVVLHEVGHLLGLNHSADPASIMLPKVKVTAIGARDMETLLALYRSSDNSGMVQMSDSARRCGTAAAVTAN
jgi:hypothetical protein